MNARNFSVAIGCGVLSGLEPLDRDRSWSHAERIFPGPPKSWPKAVIAQKRCVGKVASFCTKTRDSAPHVHRGESCERVRIAIARPAAISRSSATPQLAGKRCARARGPGEGIEASPHFAESTGPGESRSCRHLRHLFSLELARVGGVIDGP